MKITSDNIKDVFKAKESSVETLELKGYKLIKEYFVDNSGWGSANEPALTASAFENELAVDINELGSAYAFITRVGQFQVYVGLFSKDGIKKCKKIANNTLELYDDDGEVYAIRLHNTNIIEWDHDYIILNSGGWQTHTTKKRINKFLPSGVSLIQKSFEWFIKDDRDGSIKEFFDGIKIAN